MTPSEFMASLTPEERALSDDFGLRLVDAGREPNAHAVLLDGEVWPVNAILATIWELRRPGDRVVASDWVGTARISTVFLTFGHGLTRSEFFETIGFGMTGQHGPARYRTLREAQDGHQTIVAAARRAWAESGLTDEDAEIAVYEAHAGLHDRPDAGPEEDPCPPAG